MAAHHARVKAISHNIMYGSCAPREHRFLLVMNPTESGGLKWCDEREVTLIL